MNIYEFLPPEIQKKSVTTTLESIPVWNLHDINPILKICMELQLLILYCVLYEKEFDSIIFTGTSSSLTNAIRSSQHTEYASKEPNELLWFPQSRIWLIERSVEYVYEYLDLINRLNPNKEFYMEIGVDDKAVIIFKL